MLYTYKYNSMFLNYKRMYCINFYILISNKDEKKCLCNGYIQSTYLQQFYTLFTYLIILVSVYYFKLIEKIISKANR